MLAEYTGVLVMLAVAASFAAGILLASSLAGPRRGGAAARSQGAAEAGEAPFACGADADRAAAGSSSPRGRQAVKFYLAGMLFVVFLVEAVFLYLWALVFRETGAAGLVAITVFSLPLAVGLLYGWAKGAFEW